MNEIVLTHRANQDLVDSLVGKPTEECAVLFAQQVQGRNGARLLVRDMYLPTAEDYVRKGTIEAELRPEFVARVTQRARKEKLSLVFVHSHLGSASPEFSAVDDAGEMRLSAFLTHRVPGQMHAALVVSSGGVCARVLGSTEQVRVVSLGHSREVLYDADPKAGADGYDETFDRQVRAFGASGQALLGRLRVAIVGLGGTGSLIAQQLVHLGIRDFVLIDPDTLDQTNLNRVVNTTPADVGAPKVELAARYIFSVTKDAAVKAISGDIIRAAVARELPTADVIFGCTDSHGSRAVLQQVSYQYLIPCIDMGTVLVAAGGKISHISGRVQLLSPGLACFTCGGLLNPEEVRRDMLTAFERQADPYIDGAREPAPAVIAINSTVASIATTMLLSVAAGTPMKARHVLYNGITSAVRPVAAVPNPACFICSSKGALAQGDAWPLMARQD